MIYRVEIDYRIPGVPGSTPPLYHREIVVDADTLHEVLAEAANVLLADSPSADVIEFRAHSIG